MRSVDHTRELFVLAKLFVLSRVIDRCVFEVFDD